MKNILRKIYVHYPFFRHYIRFIQIFEGYNTPSYCINKTLNKSIISKLIDYLYIFFILKFMPSNYHLFGFDEKKRIEFRNYIGSIVTDPYHAKKCNSLWGQDTILVHDKYIFKLICSFHNLPVPKLFGLYNSINNEKNLNDLKLIMNKNNLKKFVLKPRFGAFGAGINFISYDDLNSFNKNVSLNNEEYIIEELIKQHNKLDKLNPYSINSIRIITLLCPDGNVGFLGAILRTSSTLIEVDNFTMGGIVIGINMNNGKLKKEGFLKYYIPKDKNNLKNTKSYDSIIKNLEIMKKRKLIHPGKILLKHPVTNTEFFNFKIPFWEELKDMTIKAQKIFKHIKSIGWDIAIGTYGPIIIEGNQTWGTTGMQAANGGLLSKKNRILLRNYGITFYER